LWLVTQLAWRSIRDFVTRIEVLSQTARKISSGDFDTVVRQTTNDEIGQLGDSFNKMIGSLKSYMSTLETTIREKESMSKEIEIASHVQQNALPRKMPSIQGLEIMAQSDPAKAVGGDYYDFLFPDPDKLICSIADVSGKGLPSSLYMFHSRSIFRTIAVAERSPSRILEKVNDQILRDTAVADGMFITYICGVYESKSRRFTYSNAGHFPPLFYNAREKTFKQTRTSGIPIGILEGQTYPEEHIDLLTGDILVFYTDGVIEAKNKDGQMFGIENLIRLIEENRSRSAKEIFTAIETGVQSFVADTSQYDDMTLLVLKSLS
jgi:sigma-B regulation protein RsbU (phosphoserine phosphatase)